jgi:hypothetical protein
MFPKTVKVWAEAFGTALGLSNQELDEPRIRAAFKSARPELETWPMPKHIIDRMPRRPEVDRITFEPAANSEYAKQAFKIASDVAAGKISQEEAKRQLDGIK